MMDKGIITFFDIDEVGFYTKNIDGHADKISGSLKETIGSLSEWVMEQNFTETIPWDVDKHDKRPPIYAKVAHTDPETNDTLFVFWYGNEDQEQSRKGIKASAKTGAFQDDSVNLKDAVSKEKTIVGNAMYYWFIPEYNLLATIDFPHSRLLSQDVFSYIRRCVNNKLDLSREDNDLVKVKEIVENSEGLYTSYYYKNKSDDKRLYFRFNAKMKYFSSSTIDLKKLARKITHIIVRDKVSYTPDNSMGNELKMLGALINTFKKKTKEVVRKPIEIIEERTVTEAELKELIDTSNVELDPNDDWIGMGFQTGTSDKPKFFKRFVHRPTIYIDPNFNMGNYYNPSHFMKVLLANRADLLLSNPAIRNRKEKELSSA